MEPEPLDRRTFIRRTGLLAGAAALPPIAGCIGIDVPVPGPIAATDPTDGSKVPFTVEEMTGEAVQVRTGIYDGLPAVLYKVRVATLEASTAARGVNTGQFALRHPTEPEHAILAYDGKCTHLGCTVGWNASLGESDDVPDYAGDGTSEGRVLCPCHQAQFDVHNLGANLPNMPAKRPLDALRIQFHDGADGTEVWVHKRYVQQDIHGADQDGPGAPFRLDGE